MKKTIFTLFLAALACNVHAQSGSEPKSASWDHMIGAQMNGLIRAVVNSSQPTSANPYLVVYSMHNKESGWGFRTGVGYNSISSLSTNAYSTNEINNTDVNIRLGVEKFFHLSKKWTAGAGVDLLYAHNDDKSSNRSFDPSSPYDSSLDATKVTQTMFGGGPFGELYYHVTDKILIGTEASFYYKTGTKDQTVISERYGYSPTETKINPTISGGSFYLPIVFYLSLRF